MGKAFVAKLAAKGAHDPEALAAWIGRKKHGKEAFAKLATAAAKKKHDTSHEEHAKPAPAKGSSADTRAEKTTQDTRDALNHALKNGWQRVPNQGNTVRRTTTHDTPAHIPASWWPGKTHEKHEFVTFIAHGGKVTGAIHSPAAPPWVERRDRKVSVKAAHQILRGQ